MPNVIDPGTIACVPGTLSGDLYTAFSALVAPADLTLVETAFKRISFAVASGWVTNVVASIDDTKFLQVDGGEIVGGAGGGGGAPDDAEYLVSLADVGIPNARVVSSTSSVVWTFGAGTATAAVPDASTTAKGIVELATDGENAASVAVQGNDSRLSDARTPTAHAASHEGGSDPIDVTALDGYPGGGTTFLRDDGTFAATPEVAPWESLTTAAAAATYFTVKNLGTIPTGSCMAIQWRLWAFRYNGGTRQYGYSDRFAAVSNDAGTPTILAQTADIQTGSIAGFLGNITISGTDVILQLRVTAAATIYTLSRVSAEYIDVPS